MSRNHTCWVALCLSITAVLPCVGQNTDRDSTWAAFLGAFEPAAFPFHVPTPIDDLSEYPLLPDTLLRVFIAPHGLAHDTEVRGGHLLYSSGSFIAITAFVALAEDKAWYLLTFTPDGMPIKKGRIAAYVAQSNSRHEHWSTLLATGRIDHTSLFRFFGETGLELSCPQSQWQWQVTDGGKIEVIQAETSMDC